MAVTGSDLLATNGGEFYVEMFPYDDEASLTTKLDTWLAQGMDVYGDEGLATAYAYIAGYNAAISLAATRAASKTLKTGENIQRTDEQLRALERARDRWQGILDGDVTEIPAPVVNAFSQSLAVPHRVVW